MRLIILLAVLVVGPASHAYEINKREMPKPIYEAVVGTLLPELSQILNMPLPADPPKISIASAQEIQKAYCKEDESCSVAAITNRDTGEIVLHEGFIPNNLFSVSILVHELVHWVQVKNQWFADQKDCDKWAMQEMQAYHVQAQWLSKHGHPGFHVPNLRAQCKIVD